MTPAQLKLHDVVRYPKSKSSFMDMMVVRIDDDGVYLRRPYIDRVTHEAAYEEVYWQKGSRFDFMVVERGY